MKAHILVLPFLASLVFGCVKEKELAISEAELDHLELIHLMKKPADRLQFPPSTIETIMPVILQDYWGGYQQFYICSLSSKSGEQYGLALIDIDVVEELETQIFEFQANIEEIDKMTFYSLKLDYKGNIEYPTILKEIEDLELSLGQKLIFTKVKRLSTTLKTGHSRKESSDSEKEQQDKSP